MLALFVGELADRLLGDAPQVGLAIALLAVLLYWRRVLGTASLLEEWGGRLAFAAAALGALLLLDVVTGLDLARATALAATAWEWALAVAGSVREWLGGVL